MRPVDVNLSQWDNTLEEPDGRYYALRLGFRQVTGFAAEEANLLISGRQQPYTTLNALRDADVPPAAILSKSLTKRVESCNLLSAKVCTKLFRHFVQNT